MYNVKDDDDYAFVMRNETHSKSVHKWIMNLGAPKDVTSCKATFNMYEVIVVRNVYLDNNSIV